MDGPRPSLRERRTSEGETRRTARHGRHCARARGRSTVSRVLQFPVFVVCLGLSIRRKTQHAQTCLLAVRAILCPDGAGRRHGQCVFSNSRLLFGKRPPPEAGREASRGFPHNAFNFILSQLFPRFRFFGRHTAIPPRGGSGRLLNALRIRQKRHSEPTWTQKTIKKTAGERNFYLPLQCETRLSRREKREQLRRYRIPQSAERWPIRYQKHEATLQGGGGSRTEKEKSNASYHR